MQIPPQYNYYEILEVREDAPQHEIHKAYERARSTYAGENPALYTVFSATEARQLLMMIEEAFSVLGNSALRSIYDLRLGQRETRLEDLTFSSLLKAQQSFVFDRPAKPQVKTPYTPNAEIEKQIEEPAEVDGAFLQKVREYKNYTVEELSEITRINPYYIKAIEKNTTKDLPAAVFVRGYVVQIAKTLGLNEKKVPDGYMKSYKLHLAKK